MFHDVNDEMEFLDVDDHMDSVLLEHCGNDANLQVPAQSANLRLPQIGNLRLSPLEESQLYTLGSSGLIFQKKVTNLCTVGKV